MAPTHEPFLGYLTVFRSRLGLANLVLDVTPLGHHSDRALRRRVRQALERREQLDLSDSGNIGVFQYLRDKKLVGANERASGRYRGLSLTVGDDGNCAAQSNVGGELTKFPVYQTDIWMSHPRVPSTIGVPTPDNTEEVVDFAYQLRLLDRTKNSWTTTGHLVNSLRQRSAAINSHVGNPFLLGAEVAALWRSLLERDGLLLRELVRLLVSLDVVRRDDVAAELPGIARDAVAAAKNVGMRSEAVIAGRSLVERLNLTATKGKSGAPGVLEHRMSPRLEWLTDLGYLSKEGRERNDFTYQTTAGVEVLLGTLDRVIQINSDWPLIAALETWRSNDAWTRLVADLAVPNEASALGAAYRTLRRPVGPAPLRDVAFVAGLMCPVFEPSTIVGRVMELTRETPGASLSGGRTTRAPENLYMTDDAVARLGTE